MSYSKPVKSVQDAPLGFRTVNQLVDNQDATKELLGLEHTEPLALPLGPRTGTLGGEPVKQLGLPGYQASQGGVHDTPKVARGELVAEFIDSTDLFAVGSGGLGVLLQTGVCTGVTRLDTGTYFVAVEGLETFDAEVFPIYDAIDTLARDIQQTPSQAGTAPGIYVTTWRERTLDSPNVGFFLYDMGFHVVVYGYREEPAPSLGTASPEYYRRGRAAMPFNRGPFRRRSK